MSESWCREGPIHVGNLFPALGGQRGVGQCILLVPAVTLIQNNQSATLACWGWPALNSITSCVFLSVVLGAPDAPKPFLAPGGPCDEMLMAQ